MTLALRITGLVALLLSPLIFVTCHSLLADRYVVSAMRWERTRTLLVRRSATERPCRPHPCACQSIYEREPCVRQAYAMCPLRERVVCGTCWDLCADPNPQWLVQRQETMVGDGPYAVWPDLSVRDALDERIEEVEHYEIDIRGRWQRTQETRTVSWSDYRRRRVGGSADP